MKGKRTIYEVNAFKGKEVGASTSITLSKVENLIMKIYMLVFVGFVLFIMVDSIIHEGNLSPSLMFGGIGGIIVLGWVLVGIMFWRHRKEAKSNLSTYNENVNTFKKEED